MYIWTYSLWETIKYRRGRYGGTNQKLANQVLFIVTKQKWMKFDVHVTFPLYVVKIVNHN